MTDTEKFITMLGEMKSERKIGRYTIVKMSQSSYDALYLYFDQSVSACNKGFLPPKNNCPIFGLKVEIENNINDFEFELA